MPTAVQQLNIAHIWTISNSLVNEARFTYMRENQIGFQAPGADEPRARLLRQPGPGQPVLQRSE